MADANLTTLSQDPFFKGLMENIASLLIPHGAEQDVAVHIKNEDRAIKVSFIGSEGEAFLYLKRTPKAS